jgi:hypothetical protein
MHKEVVEGVEFSGVLTFTNFLVEDARARAIDRYLQGAHNLSHKEYNQLIGELISRCRMREMRTTNQVVLAGRAVFRRILMGDTTYTGAINYGLLGTSSTAVADSDTQLGTEAKRKLFSYRTGSDADLTIRFYYSKADTNGTYQEFGTVIDGTATTNTGQLYNRALTGGWTKSSAEGMTVSLTIHLNYV